MIGLSILTALGLDAWIENVNHAQAASVASKRMDDELRGNLADIGRAMVHNQKALESLLKLDAVVADDLKAGRPAATINEHIQAQRKLFALNLHFPGLSTDAWDVAVANQSAGWMSPAALQRYSAAYSAEREMNSWMQHDSVVLFDGPRMVNFTTDLRDGNAVDPREFLYEIRQMETILSQAQGQLRGLREDIRKAMPPSRTATRYPPASAGTSHA